MAQSAVALVDLGDTLADCRAALMNGMAALRRSGEPEIDDVSAALPAHLEPRRSAVLAAPGFWRELAPRPAGFEILELLLSEGFHVYIVTKGPRGATQAWADKVAWCRAHVPELPVVVTDDKTRIHGHVLVDDWPPYVERWQRQWPAGLGVLPAQPWNQKTALGAKCIRRDGNDDASLVSALRMCREAVETGHH